MRPVAPGAQCRHRCLLPALTGLIQFPTRRSWYLFSVVLKPIDAEFGWGRGPLSLAFALMGITQALIAPFVGGLLDRIGPRWVISSGFVICSVGTVLATRADSAWEFALTFGLIVGIGMGGA